MVLIVRESSNHEEFQQLVRRLDADLGARYGTLQAAYDPYNATDNVETVVLAYVDHHAVGCGGLKPYDHETGEIKRMYVKPAYRNMGIAGQILGELNKGRRNGALFAPSWKQAENSQRPSGSIRNTATDRWRTMGHMQTSP